MKTSERTAWSAADRTVAVASSVALAIVLVSAGFIACAVPDAPTRLLSQAFSNEEDSPYSAEELTAAAVAVKRYTIDHNDDTVLYKAMEAVVTSAEADGREIPTYVDLYSTYIIRATLVDGDEEEAAGDNAEAEADDSLSLESYVLTDDALSHLDDVYRVVQAAKPFLIIAALIAYVGCIAVAFRRGSAALGGVLMSAGGVVLSLFTLCALWAAINFNEFFSVFHSLFFAEGTWTFAADSLLICLYPISFWLGMGSLWLVITVAACLLCLIMGRSLRQRSAGTTVAKEAA